MYLFLDTNPVIETFDAIIRQSLTFENSVSSLICNCKKYSNVEKAARHRRSNKTE